MRLILSDLCHAATLTGAIMPMKHTIDLPTSDDATREEAGGQRSDIYIAKLLFAYTGRLWEM